MCKASDHCFPEETRRHYRGWLVELNWLLEWEATHPDFDGPDDNRYVVEREWSDLTEAVDEWILENEPDNRLSTDDLYQCAVSERNALRAL